MEFHMTNFPTLETDRLILRRLELSDAPQVYEYMKDREIAYNTFLIPYPYPEGAAEEWITGAHQSAEQGDDLGFAVMRKADGLFMGACGIHLNPEHQRAEIGYWLGKPHRGQGYTSEAARRLIQFGFEELGLNRIYASYFTRNPASRRVMEKAGMTFEGVMRQSMLKWGDFVDRGMCAILRSEYEAQQAAR
jgi:ribosomal-protein-alanine N-acetyltransferase